MKTGRPETSQHLPVKDPIQPNPGKLKTEMGYLPHSTVGAIAATLSISANFYAQFLIRDMLEGFEMQYLARWGAAAVIAVLCLLIYGKLSGEKGADPIMNLIISLGPPNILPYVLDGLEGYYQKKSGCM
jgi:hypothetical protein